MRVLFLTTVVYTENNTAKVETESTVPNDPQDSVSKTTRPQGRSVCFLFMMKCIIYLTIINSIYDFSVKKNYICDF